MERLKLVHHLSTTSAMSEIEDELRGMEYTVEDHELIIFIPASTTPCDIFKLGVDVAQAEARFWKNY